MCYFRSIGVIHCKTQMKTIKYITRLSKSTIWRIMIKLQKHLVPKYYDSLREIGGNDTVVEIDESKFGKRKYHRGHTVEGVWILGMVEKTCKRRIKLIAVENRSADTLTEIITDSVNENSTIHTDCWRGYNRLQNNFENHYTVNHSKNFKDPETGVHTNTIEGEWSAVKFSVPFRGRTKSKIALYLVRYMILRNENEHPLEALVNFLFY